MEFLGDLFGWFLVRLWLAIYIVSEWWHQSPLKEKKRSFARTIGKVFTRARVLTVATTSAYFASARIGANMMTMTMAASVIGYIGYLMRTDGWPDEFETALLIGFVIAALIVYIWNRVAAALWRRRPEWYQKIKRAGQKAPRIALMTTVVTCVAFVFGWKGFVLTFFFALLLGVVPLVCGVLAWPVIAFSIWLPMRRKWKFGDLFCDAIQSCGTVL